MTTLTDPDCPPSVRDQINGVTQTTAVLDDELQRYIARCEELSNDGEYTWWSRLAEILRSRAEQREAPSVVVGEGLVRIGTWRHAPNGNNWLDLTREAREVDWPADTAIFAAAPTSDGR